MTPLIKKAYKGNRDAMTELYQSNKQITDLKDVDLTNFEATEETEEYTIATGTVIYTVVDGELTEIESSEIVVGDMLVIDDGADEGVTIVVYHAETSSDSGDGTVTE